MWKAAILFSVIISGAAYWGGAGGLGTTAVLLGAGLAWFLVRRAALVAVPELAVGVITHRQRQAFVRFVPYGRHWLNPLTERLDHTIAISPTSASGRCYGAQTSGGIALDVEWVLSYNLNPLRIPAEARPRLARTLASKAGGIASKHVNNCLRHVLSEYTMDELCQAGILKRLEREVRQQVTARLAPLGFEISRVMLGAIEMPPAVRAALELAQERAVQTENEARTLARLQAVVSQFSDADMQRLMELERIHAMGQHGVALVYPAAAPLETASKPINSYTRLAAKRAVVAPGVS